MTWTTNVVLRCVMATVLLWPGFGMAEKPQARFGALADVASDVMVDAKVSGGIEVAQDCSQRSPSTYQVDPADLNKSLESLSRQDSSLTWRTNDRGSYTVAIGTEHPSQIAALQVPEKKIAAASVSAAVDMLLSDPTVKRELRALKLEQISPQLGYTSIHEGHMKSIMIPAGRLDDALNIIATEFGPAVWRLDERTCNGRQTFQITWILE